MNALTLGIAVAAAMVWLSLQVRIGLVAARMYQIEEYESRRFLRWAMQRTWIDHRAALVAVLTVIAGYAIGFPLSSQRLTVLAGAWLVASLAAHALWRWPPAKRPLVRTARMRRLGVTAVVLAVAWSAGTVIALAAGARIAATLLVYAAAFVTITVPLLLAAANLVLNPVEAAVRAVYLRRARRRLREVDPLVIAVAGSYGKTSTKHILAPLLQPSISTLPTRKSFNTLMGVTRAVNEDLRSEHRIFIVEMDAYAPGEIASICRLVRPTVAIVTAVGPQHLERFRSMNRIADALYETVAGLPRGATALIHTGEAGGAALARRAAADGYRAVGYAADDAGEDSAEVTAAALEFGPEGTAFVWRWPAEQLERRVRVPLLGRHQVLNVTAALAAVHLLGHDLDAAVQAAAALAPVEHRLQRLPATGPLTVIDDSYNANPVGVHNALEVLAAIGGGKRILVTPGLVELGSVEAAENRRYGEHAAAVCDHVIVVAAAPAAALLEGLRAGGLAEERIHLVDGLDSATAVLRRLGGPGDVVLFANDLPDTYLPGRTIETGAIPKAGR